MPLLISRSLEIGICVVAGQGHSAGSSFIEDIVYIGARYFLRLTQLLRGLCYGRDSAESLRRVDSWMHSARWYWIRSLNFHRMQLIESAISVWVGPSTFRLAIQDGRILHGGQIALALVRVTHFRSSASKLLLEESKGRIGHTRHTALISSSIHIFTKCSISLELTHLHGITSWAERDYLSEVSSSWARGSSVVR